MRTKFVVVIFTNIVIPFRSSQIYRIYLNISRTDGSFTDFSMLVDLADDTASRRVPPSPDRRRQPAAILVDDVIEALPVSGGRDRRRRVERRSAEVYDHVTRASRPTTWSCDVASDVIVTSLNQRGDVDRGIIASTP